MSHVSGSTCTQGQTIFEYSSVPPSHQPIFVSLVLGAMPFRSNAAAIFLFFVLPGQVFSTVHNVYVNYLRNPFSPLGKPVDSDRFRLAVDRQINDYNS